MAEEMGKGAGDLQKARMTETGKAKRKWEREVKGKKRTARGQGTWNKDQEREQRAGKGPGKGTESSNVRGRPGFGEGCVIKLDKLVS